MKLESDRITDLTPEVEFPPLSDFLAVASGECRWPGDGLECCGRLARKQGPYCEHHHTIGFRRKLSEEGREALGEHFTKLLYSHKFSKGRSAHTLGIRATPEELGL